MDGLPLVGRFFVEKGTFKLALPRCIRLKGVALQRGACGLNGEKLRSQIAHCVFGVLLGLLPTTAAKSVELRARLAGTDVFANEMRFTDGDVELGRGLIWIAGRVLDDKTL